MQDIHFQLSTSSFGLNVWRRLTDNLDFEARGGFASLILQDYLVIASVLPLCDINCQACLVAIRFSADPVTSLKNHLGTARQHQTQIQSTESKSKDAIWASWQHISLQRSCIG